MTDQGDSLHVPTELLEALERHLAAPDDLAGLFYLGTAAILYAEIDGITSSPRAAVDLALDELRDRDGSLPPAAERLVEALWPDAP